MHPPTACARSLCWAAGLVVLGLGPYDARAEAAPQSLELTLDWEAPASCPSKEDIVQGVVRATASERDLAPLDARVRIDGRGVLWHADLTVVTRGMTTVRRIEGASCGEVTDALVLIMALAASGSLAGEPTGSVEPAASAPSASASPPSPPAPPAPRPREALLAPSPASPSGRVVARDAAGEHAAAPPRWGLDAALAIDSGTLPTVGAGPALDVWLRVGRFELEASGLLLDAGSANLTQRTARSPEGANLFLVQAMAAACAILFDRPHVRLAPCAAAGAEWILAHDFGSESKTPATATVGALGFGVEARVPLTRHFALGASLGAAVPLEHPYFFITENGSQFVVFREPAVAARASLGAGVLF